MRKTYQEQLTPTPPQEREVERVLWRGRTRYHTALEQRITRWRQRGVSLTRSQQEAEVKALRAGMPEDGAIHAQVVPDVLARLEQPYHAVFRRVASGEKPGVPRFHGTNRSHSFTDKECGNGARLENGSLVLSQMGRIAVRWSRPIAGTPKTVTIAKEADGWYVSFSCAEVPVEPLPLTGRDTGIAVGRKVFLITADGESVETPRHDGKAETELKQAQRHVSRRTKGSKRRAKAAAQCGKKQQHVRRQRADVHHQTALARVRAYDVLSVEAIQAANVSRRPAPKPDENGNGGYEHNGASRKAGLNTSIHDAGWHHFRSLLADKAACAGKRVEAVNPAYTSQDGSAGGARIQKSLSVRTHVCTTCGLMLDRDENAARNIFWRGQRLRAVAGMPAAMNREPVGL